LRIIRRRVAETKKVAVPPDEAKKGS
jgi:hypothetical protein